MLLSAAYLPPVSYIALLASTLKSGAGDGIRASSVRIEAMESYPKQTWRNRCRILSAGGPEDLNVPVRHGGSRLMRDILIDYSEPWVLKHKRAIMSAYSSSSFYEYYSDGLFAILDSRPETLLELDLALTRWLLERFALPVTLVPTVAFEPVAVDDFRDAAHPKRPDNILSSLGLDRPYWQVFPGAEGFVSGLSAIDLLFNEGPQAAEWLVARN